jgi:hypothetical protein
MNLGENIQKGMRIYEKELTVIIILYCIINFKYINEKAGLHIL